MRDQQRLRPACAYTQTDQSLCLSLEISRSAKLLTEYRLEFLSLKGGCTGSYESTLVKIPHCWKPHVAAHILVQVLESIISHFSEIEDDMVDDKDEDPEWSRLAKALSLCIAYAANIGGTGSMIGSTPNLVLKGQIEK